MEIMNEKKRMASDLGRKNDAMGDPDGFHNADGWKASERMKEGEME